MRLGFCHLCLFFVAISYALDEVSASKIAIVNTTTVKAAAAQADTTKSGDLDEEVSDIKLRVSSGARSKYSTTLFFHYQGASLASPMSDKRPNVIGGRNAEPVYTSGDVYLRYRQNKNESYYFATGYYRERPFHSREADERIRIDNPSLGYNHTFAANDLQISSGFRLYISTADYLRAIGQVGTLGYSLSTINQLGASRFNAGVSLLLTASAYDSNDEKMKQRQSDYGVSLTPTLQYNKTGRVNAFTSLYLFNYSHYRSDNTFNFDRRKITQSIGVGVAVIRDFYLAPNISFNPQHISTNMTAVNLNAYVNL
ncbi:MAG: hypothetical protein A2Z20_09460 [Bdellovibrionales bacterium RBG_16_40_8]|nr:MAG: hypothetical protein A2Z20_09460 [Bdellovibrionales bacterium RBG_16_40_8]